jgi:DNA-binding transcriptional regulator YdaS (Cro superfamily)
MTPLQRAIEHCGSQSELARRMGGKVRTAHIYHWLRNGVTAERCIAIEHATGGAVTRYDLRPDVFGQPPSIETAPENATSAPPSGATAPQNPASATQSPASAPDTLQSKAA